MYTIHYGWPGGDPPISSRVGVYGGGVDIFCQTNHRME